MIPNIQRLRKGECDRIFGMSTYTSKAHSKFLLRYHLVIVTKYRRRILSADFDSYIKQELTRISRLSDSKFSIEVMESDKDHVHMMISSEPTVSPSAVARRLKQISTVSAWKRFPEYLQKAYWRDRVLWSSGYFVCTTGDASAETIRHYIENQG